MNNQSDIVSAMVVIEGHIIATGKEADLRKEYKTRKEIDLKGKPIFPGFIDPHCHFYSYGLTLRQTDLTGTISTKEITDRLVQNVTLNPGKWVLGRGWDQNDWHTKIFPNKKLLDSLFPDIPVYLVRIDGHAAWVNSKAIALAGIGKNTRIEGGEILFDQHGPTGILIDNAMALVEKLIPPATRDEKMQALLKAQSNCFTVGLTSVGDAGLDKEIVELIDSLQKKDFLHMHINAMLNPSKENIDFYINKGIYETDRLTVRSIKLYADGALGSRGALLKKPYTDDLFNRGLQVSETKYLKDICRLAYDKGYQVNTHCIGDSAVSLVLHLYASILSEQNDRRWRIEHAQVVDPADLEMFKRYAVIPSVQTTHATSDMYWAEKRLGSLRIAYAYAYRSLLEQNGWMPNGSDFPVESINPVYGFYAAIARKDLQGMPAGGYHKEQALSREQALKAMTIWAAKASFEETNRGSLEPGKDADFVVLDRDIMKVPEDSIAGAHVLETWIKGIRQPSIEHNAYVKEMDQWHADRLSRLKDKNGWLALAGLFWLEEGSNTFGSDISNRLVFPKYAPPFIGTLELQDSTVYLQETVQPVLIDGVPASHVKLVDDMSGKPTRMVLGRYAWNIIKRGDRFGVRMRDFESPLLDSLKNVPIFETNEHYRVVADYKPFDVPEKQVVHTVIGTDAENTIPGVLSFRLNGKKYKLYPAAYDGEWSIVFGDMTNGEETYDAGRYLDISAPDENNKVIIDFNKAYNPPCAFTPYATCQLPHRSNILPVRIEAGEKAVHLVQVH